MKTYSERKWWHFLPLVASGLVFLLCLLGLSLHEDAGLIFYSLEVGAFLSPVALYLFGTALLFRSYNYGTFALVDRATGKVIDAGFESIILSPWPFKTKYRAVSYRRSFGFSCTLQPITANPKVVRLTTSVVVKATDKGVTDPVLLLHVSHPGKFKSPGDEINRHLFEILNHKMPQDIGSALNPYDEQSIERLRRFVANELRPIVQFDHEVSVTVSQAA